MKNLVSIIVLILCVSWDGAAQTIQKVIVSYQKVGDGLYDFYAENPNFAPMQMKLHFTDFENMSADVILPYVGTLQHGKRLIFRVKRVLVDLPGSFKYKYNTRLGAFPVVPDKTATYQLPFVKKNIVKMNSLDYSESKTPEKIILNFEVADKSTLTACREGIVCSISKLQMRNDRWVGDNTITILHSDQTFGKYEHLADSSMLVNLGDEVAKGDPLAMVKDQHLLFSVYYVNASIDSIVSNRLRRYHAYLDPIFKK